MKRISAIFLTLMLCLSVLSISAFATEDTYTIHVKVPEGSKTPNIWAWGAADSMPAGAQWPGVAMTADGEWYTFDVSAGTNGMVINTDGNTDKSGDIALNGGDVWVVLTIDASGHFAQESISYEAPEADVDNPADTPVENPTDEPIDEPADEPADEPIDEPTDEPADEPTDEPTDEPANPEAGDDTAADGEAKPEESKPEETEPSKKKEKKEENIDYGARRTKALLIIGGVVLAVIGISMIISIPKKIKA